MNTKLPFLLFLTITVTSCSSISKDDCKKDMRSLGIDHGKRGMNNLSDDVRSTCNNSTFIADIEQYEKGFNIGWSLYCTPRNGFESGRKGDSYKSFCPTDKEDLFHEKFLIGKKVYEKKDQVSELETRVNDLTQSAEHDLGAKEELNKTKEYLLNLTREIQTLERQGENPAKSAL